MKLLSGISLPVSIAVLVMSSDSARAATQLFDPGPNWARDICDSGTSVEELIDEVDVYGAADNEIGEVEDLLIAADGRILGLMFEAEGFLGLSSTNLRIPWDEVQVGEGWVRLPVTEESIGNYGVFEDEGVVRQILGGDEADPHIQEDRRAWRASEVIGDVVRTKGGEGFTNFGMVTDLLIRGDHVVAAVLTPDFGLNLGNAYSVPFRGYEEQGWLPGSPKLDLSYDVTQLEDIGAFECHARELQVR